MCFPKSSPYSKSNSSCPLFSAGQQVAYPAAAASRRIVAPNCSSTRIPALSLGSPARTTAVKASKITRLAAAISPVCCRLNSPSHPNIFFWKEPGDRMAKCTAAYQNQDWSCRLLRFPVITDQVVGRTVMRELRLCFALDLWNDALRQHLAQLDTPLIKRVDVPDCALGEDGVFI